MFMVELLLKRIANPGELAQSVTIITELIQRDSRRAISPPVENVSELTASRI